LAVQTLAEDFFFYIYVSVNVPCFCIEGYDDVPDVHAADEVARAVSNVDVRKGRKSGWGDRIGRRWPCPEV
jgi:hypothetical protein